MEGVEEEKADWRYQRPRLHTTIVKLKNMLLGPEK